MGEVSRRSSAASARGFSRRNSGVDLPGTARLVGRELCEGLDLDGIDARAVAASHAPAGLAAISSRQGLWIAELDKEEGPFLSKCQDKNVRLLDLGSVAWSPRNGKPGCLAAVNKRCVLLWDTEKSQVCANFESGGGQRSLTDLHWEHVLVTGGMDGSVSIHDPRQLTKVAAIFQTKASGHMQVRCSRLNPNLIAGANAGTVRVWDIRAGNRALHSIMAHVSNKIGTVDWHPRIADELMTCSPTEPDVKVWSLQASNVDSADSERVVKLPGVAHGVSAVLYLPSGSAIATSHPDSKLRLSALTPAVQVGNAIADDVAVDRRMDWVTNTTDAGAEEDKAVLFTAGGGAQGRLQWWLLAPQLVQPVHTAPDRPPDSPRPLPEPGQHPPPGALALEVGGG